jgi:hypothetical protein
MNLTHEGSGERRTFLAVLIYCSRGLPATNLEGLESMKRILLLSPSLIQQQPQKK